MDTVVLRRRGFVFARMRPLQLAGQCLGLAGVAGLALLIVGWPPPVAVWFWPVALIALVPYPHKVFVADRDGVTFGLGSDRMKLGWNAVAQIVVAEGAGRLVRVGIRPWPGAVVRTRPWDQVLDALERTQLTGRWRRPRRDKPFALVYDEAITGHSAADLAGRLAAVASAPIAQASVGDDRAPYTVRAPFRSVLPLAIFFLAWNGGIGSAMAVGMMNVIPRAALPLAVAGVGIALILADLLIPRAALATDPAGLRFDGEFLAWSEINAISLGVGVDGTELVIRLDPSAPAALVEPEVRRLLRRVHADPAQLAAAAPTQVRTEAISPA
jgi:hypothetical protein